MIRAKYFKSGREHYVKFDDRFTQETAAKLLHSEGVQNFFFMFSEPIAPTSFDEKTMLHAGEIGFDITRENILSTIEAGKDIIIDSVGGSLYEGWRILDAIKLKGYEGKITGTGIIASAATLLLTATSNNSITENARVLIHNPYQYMEGDFERMAIVAKELENETDALATHYSNYTGQSVEFIKDLMKKDTVLTANEAFNIGLIKQINNMDKQQTEGLLSKLENLLNKFVPSKIKNIVVQDANGVELEFPDNQSLDTVQVGSAVKIDGQNADGSWTLQDGTIIMAENGLVTSIERPTSDEVTQLQEANAQLQNKVKDLETKLAEAENANSVLAKGFEDVRNEFEAVKKMTSKAPVPTNTQTPATGEPKPKGFSYKKK